MTSLDNYPLEMIVDEFGSLSELAKDCKARMEILRAELLTRGVNYAQGETYDVTVTHSERTSLNAEKIRDEMPDDWIEEHSKTSPVTTMRSNRIAKATKVAA